MAASANSDVATTVVSAEQRMPRGSLTMAWWSICSAMFYIFLAAALALGFGTANAVIGMVLSVISYGILNGVMVRYSIRTGLSCALLSRILFGNIGASLATLILFATAIYYAVFEGSVVAVAASKVVPSLSYGTACIIVVLYSVPLILGSVQHWLDRFNGVLLPVYLIGLALMCAVAVYKFGYSSAWLHLGPEGGAPAGGWWNCYVAYMGVWVLMMYTVDFARFGKLEDADFHARVSFGMPFYSVAFLLNGLVGIFLVGTVKLDQISETAVVDAALAVLGGALGLAFVWVTQTRINTANYYVATVNMQAFFERISPLRAPKLLWAMVTGVVILVLMRSTDVFSYILLALGYQGIFVTAWVGVALVHMLVGTNEAASQNFNPRGLTAWIAGTAAGIVLMRTPGAAASFASPAAFLIASAVYWAMNGGWANSRSKRRLEISRI